MTIDLGARGVRLVLLDIEGTTTPITFVYDVLFPYARSHLRAFFRDGAEATVGTAVALLRAEHAREPLGDETLPAWHDAPDERPLDPAVMYAEWLMERDSKSPALKHLQGIIWEGGYAAGELHGDVFEDVPRALTRWASAGITSAIYSSGSVLAQRLLFSSTAYGDLTTRLGGFFDTGVGPKREAASYRAIAAEMRVAPSMLLFVSDVTAELVAAREAGCQIALCVRPGNPVQDDSPADVITTFDTIVV